MYWFVFVVALSIRSYCVIGWIVGFLNERVESGMQERVVRNYGKQSTSTFHII